MTPLIVVLILFLVGCALVWGATSPPAKGTAVLLEVGKAAIWIGVLLIGLLLTGLHV